MKTIRLGGPTDLDGFREAARRLMSEGVPPDAVEWVTGAADDGSLWSLPAGPSGHGDERCADPAERGADVVDGAEAASSIGSESGIGGGPRVTVPASFLDLCRGVVLHREPQRFALLYRLLWRLRARPAIWRDRLDPDRRLAEQLIREVRHELHKMRAFVRFTPVEDAAGTRHVAWFEPEHFIVDANGPFFARRFSTLRWAILTPRGSLAWDGQRLCPGPPARREDAPPPDADAGLWLTYYRSIFNPARLKVAMMEREMPRRYWTNLPEAALIAPLVNEARQRTRAMLEAEPGTPRTIRAIERDHRTASATGLRASSMKARR